MENMQRLYTKQTKQAKQTNQANEHNKFSGGGDHDLTTGGKNDKNDKNDKNEAAVEDEILLLPPLKDQHDFISYIGQAWAQLEENKRQPYETSAKQLEQNLLTIRNNLRGSTTGTERSQAQTTTSTIEKILSKLKNENDYDLSIMRLKNHGLPPNINSGQMNRVLEALERCETIQVLYVQNLANGMRDEQLRRLMRVSTCMHNDCLFLFLVFFFIIFLSFFFFSLSLCLFSLSSQKSHTFFFTLLLSFLSYFFVFPLACQTNNTPTHTHRFFDEVKFGVSM